MSTAEHAIRRLHETWIAAVNAGNLPLLLTLITDDLVLMSPGQAPSGREAFAATFTSALEQLTFVCTSEPEEITVVGDIAYTRCRDALTVTPRAGGPTTHLAGHRLTVYRRQADGRWLLARDAHTLTVVPAPSSHPN